VASRRFSPFLILALLAAAPLPAQICGDVAGDDRLIGFTLLSGAVPAAVNCNGLRCYPPLLQGVRYETRPVGCNPHTTVCQVAALVPTVFRGNAQNPGVVTGHTEWHDQNGVSAGSCGAAGAAIRTDRGESWLVVGGFSCANPEGLARPGVYSLFTNICQGACGAPSQTIPVEMTPLAAHRALCGTPPPFGCPEDPPAGTCCLGPGGGTSPAGGGPGASPPGSGPGAHLRYRAGGAGAPGTPGNQPWIAAGLGAGWAHDYAERIVPGSQPNQVWLLTRYATFRTYMDANADGVYETVAPSDEERTLRQVAGGWQLRGLDGTVQTFDAAGNWTSTTDRAGNAKVATYSNGRLTEVTFPDGRLERFLYLPPAGPPENLPQVDTGYLRQIQEFGLGNAGPTPDRTWVYFWVGFDLTEIRRPDGTAWRFEYADPRHPGHLTRMILVGTDGSERVEGAWEYDDRRNVTRTWRGADDFTDPAAVDTWELAYDDPDQPDEVTVTDPLAQETLYEIEREAASGKPRLARITGDCPSCGLGPNSQLFYEDAAEPLRPTRQVDGKGHVTLTTYTAHGQPATRTEAAGTAQERTTSWEYDPVFPAFTTREERPSTSGGGALRTSEAVYDAEGNASPRTISGAEAGAAFSLATASLFNAAGQPLSIDPPGHGTTDATSFTYDPARGSLLPLTRTEPLVGVTAYGYDPLNRRTSVTDPNGVITTTAYDPLDRTTQVIQKGATPADDLITTHVYSVFGDLDHTVLPRGNVIDYGYDGAGRIIWVERKADLLTPGERIFYTLDAYGHRIKEERQRWTGSAWETRASTDFVYSTRCHLDKTIYPDGTATEYAYDCNGNLEQLWDAAHPRASFSPTQSFSYDALDRLTSVTQPWAGAGGGAAVTSYGYDVQDHLTSVTDAEGGDTTYLYSDRDLMTRQVSEVSGTTESRYDEHGELAQETDARGITMVRTVDPLDRVTAMDYPGTALDVSYTYDAPAVPFSKGRLTAITKGGETVAYRYDRFGRVLQDGGLEFGYDQNGNRTSVRFPRKAAGFTAAITAHSTFDFADRETAISYQEGTAPVLVPLVTSSTYEPFGPLASLMLGNGATEAHGLDDRYLPTRVSVTRTQPLLDWDYATDDIGNITGIADLLDSTRNRTYEYQDQHYFLTRGDGPWGTRAWTYDRIGNRLTESQDGNSSVSSYVPNALGGNSATLDQVTPTAGAPRAYTFDPAGNLTRITTGPGFQDLTPDAAGRLARLGTDSPGFPQTVLAYDGRGYLRRALYDQASAALASRLLEPTYDSEGLLRHHFARTRLPLSFVERESDTFVLHFSGRPVALLDQSLPTTATFGDVQKSHFAWRWVEDMVRFGITSGCGGGNYCPTGQVTRAQMAVFLLVARHGAGYQPPPATGTMFLDVPLSHPVAAWIEQLAREGITGGCGGGNFCPGNPVNRAQMAVFLLVAKYGPGYAPPPATGTVFSDVPANGFAAAWIEQLVREGITGGCGGGNYCPASPVNRAQMAIFLSTAFRLGLTYLGTDHLGTPNLATAVTGRVTWDGGFEPFGADWNGAQAKGMFLRFPGQWVDGGWENAGVGSGLAYNANRWYEPQTGRYASVDPLSREGPRDLSSLSGGHFTAAVRRSIILAALENLRRRGSFVPEGDAPFAYVNGMPTRLSDPLGLAIVWNCGCKPVEASGNPGTGQGSGEQVRFVIPPDCKPYGGPGQPVPGTGGPGVTDVDFVYQPGGKPVKVPGTDRLLDYFLYDDCAGGFFTSLSAPFGNARSGGTFPSPGCCCE
jgi:YD repeat-containing protein